MGLSELALLRWLHIVAMVYFVMREWTVRFRQLATEGDNPEIENQLERSISFSRKLAYLYWIGIGSVAFLGVTKPF